VPPLTIRIKKKKDGSAALSCQRADGSATWQRQEGANGRFFPIHDLTHFAVETVLGLRRGFYGLVSEGWDMDDFGAPWTKGPMPPETGHAELLVGLFDTDRAGGTRSTAAELNASVASYLTARGGSPPPALTDEDLAHIRARLSALLAEWRETPAGEALELVFDPDQE
jgi:hypothetical protein